MMSDFNNQREVWSYISANETNRVTCNDLKHVYGFKNGELWDYTENKYTELYFYKGSDWSKYVQPPDELDGMKRLQNIGQAFDELVKGNRVYKCYTYRKGNEWYSVGLVNGNLVYEDGSSGTNFFGSDDFDKFYIKENV
jgi:hypothetical protein